MDDFNSFFCLVFSVCIHNDRAKSSDLFHMPFFHHETVMFLFLGLESMMSFFLG